METENVLFRLRKVSLFNQGNRFAREISLLSLRVFAKGLIRTRNRLKEAANCYGVREVPGPPLKI